METIAPSTSTRAFLVVTMAAMVGLVQFPYATPTYFCYAAPMTILAVLAVVYARPHAPRLIHVTIAAFFMVFALVFVNRSYGWNLGVQFLPYNPGSRLDMQRGGLWVSEQDKETYEGVVRLLQTHAAGGMIYAGPDCPEIYFLSGFNNLEPVIFDFLTEAHEDASWMTRLLARAPIRAVVINTGPDFSPRLDAKVVELLERRFPKSQQVGRFVVRFE
jgi:predicted neutral ceramidase superfamily lipid hydrolase